MDELRQASTERLRGSTGSTLRSSLEINERAQPDPSSTSSRAVHLRGHALFLCSALISQRANFCSSLSLAPLLLRLRRCNLHSFGCVRVAFGVQPLQLFLLPKPSQACNDESSKIQTTGVTNGDGTRASNELAASPSEAVAS